MKFIALLLLLTSCVTPYQPKGFRGGYEEVEVGTNKYMVSFTGNGNTSAITVQQYGLRRARELCNEKGFSDFTALENQLTNDKSSATINCWGGNNCNVSETSRHSYAIVISCSGSNGQPAVAPAH